MNNYMWEKAAAFHGHVCPGLAIGARAVEAAIEKMNIAASPDEELVCIAENDACCVDAIQSILGCTLGKGNLIYKPTGKMAFTFINRETGEAKRFYYRGKKGSMDRNEYLEFILTAPLSSIFIYRNMDGDYPEAARSFESVTCEACGEETSENMIRVQNSKKLCLDCYKPYSRGWQ